MLAFSFLVGGFALRAIELVDGDLAVVLRGVFGSRGLVLDLLRGGVRGDWFGAVCISISFKSRVILMVGSRVAGLRSVGIEEGPCVGFHLHLRTCATERDLRSVWRVLGD